MTIDALRQSLPDSARDIRLNLGSLFDNIAQSTLTESQFQGTALAVALSLKNRQLVDVLTPLVRDEVAEAARIAATLMAMNNVYYRAIHLAESDGLRQMPANLRMNAMANPGVPAVDFEMYALAVSAVNGCGMCIHSHVAQLQKQGVSNMGIQSVLRLAATLNATHQALWSAA